MRINSNNIPDNLIKQLVSDVKDKKELSGIMDSFVKAELIGYIEKNRKTINFFSSAKDYERARKSKHYKEIIKKTRETLRKSAGVFLKPTKITSAEELLKKHESTRGRLETYSELYQRIFHITGYPYKILDLGCGLNPLSYKYLKTKPKYYAYDINSIVVEIVNDFFKKRKINGKANLLNLREAKTKKLKLPKADICFLFKVLDSIELEKGHKLAEKLIRQLPCRWVVASFSTRTLSGKRMRHPYRGWVEQMCRRLGYFYEVVEYENELFYLIRKH